MAEQENKSEVARLMARIDSEYRAARLALSGLAVGTARHAFINARMEQMGQLHQELQQVAGKQEANKLLTHVLENVPEELS